MLSPRAMTVPGIGGYWAAIRCKTNHEKRLASDLLRGGFDYFLPLVQRVDKWRNVTHAPPMFLRGMVFASCQDDPAPDYAISSKLFYFLIDHASYYGTIAVSRAAQPQFQLELEEIHHKIVTGELTDSAIGFAIVGQVCRIRDGFGMGQIVTIDRIIAPGRVEVAMPLMGDLRSYEIDARHLEPVTSN